MTNLLLKFLNWLTYQLHENSAGVWNMAATIVHRGFQWIKVRLTAERLKTLRAFSRIFTSHETLAWQVQIYWNSLVMNWLKGAQNTGTNYKGTYRVSQLKGPEFQKQLSLEYQNYDTQNLLVFYLIYPIKFGNLPDFKRLPPSCWNGRFSVETPFQKPSKPNEKYKKKSPFFSFQTMMAFGCVHVFCPFGPMGFPEYFIHTRQKNLSILREDSKC